MKRYASFLMLVILFINSFSTNVSAASQTEISEQLKNVKQEIEAAKQLEKKATTEIKRIQNQKEEYNEQIVAIEKEIQVTSDKLFQIEEQINDVEENLSLTNEELVVAEERVIQRDKLLKSRLRLLYTRGFVSYLDVLLSSTSFMDFVDRLSAIQSIIKQDKNLVAMLTEDKQEVERKKKDIESQLAYVEDLFIQTNELKQQLQTKRQNKEVAIASLETQEEELVLLSEEQEEQLFKLVDEQSKLIKKQAELNKKSSNKKITKYTGGQLQWPLPSSDRITSYAGGRIHPITGKPQNHSGLDIAAPGGSKIVAAASGTVVLAQWYGNFGNTVIVEHKDGFRTLYAHIRPGGIKVNAGDEVEAGDKIAEVGTTGRSTGNHLHFGVYVDNKATDPIPYLEE